MSIWAMYGTSEFPLTQPMVGQDEFYKIFKTFTKNMKTAGLATIFPLISRWGVGKSRIGFEVISEPLGMDKGWIITEDGEQQTVKIFKPNFEDGVLPIYIRYSQMYHEDLLGDNWVAYGIYTALKYLSQESDGSIQGKIMEAIQNALAPMGFDRDVLKGILQHSSVDIDSLVIDSRKLDELTRNSINYIKKFGIEHILIVCDELETEAEIAKYGIEKDKELISKIDGESIQVITSAIKHEDPRKKYPDVSYLLLCSTVIGGSIQGIGALDRRTEMYEMLQNSFADISDYIKYLKDKGMVPEYPQGLVEAAYAIAGGNFGWFNVIMGNVDQQIKDGIKPDTGFIFENILKGSARFQTSLIDKSAFDYIQCEDKYRQIIKHALLRQIPVSKSVYNGDEIKALTEAKAEDGEKLFKEFNCVKIAKDDLAAFLVKQGYKRDSGDMFVNSFGGKFDLQVFLKSLKTFSINVKEQEYIVGKEEETFLDQIRMLYPVDDIEEAARYIYKYILEKIEGGDASYIGPNFAYLSRLDKRYRVEKDDFGYVPDSEKNKEIEKIIEERNKNKKEEVKRVLAGICRVLEISYPEGQPYTIHDVDCVRTKVENGPYLDVHGDKIVDIIWGKDEDKIKDVLSDSRLLKEGVHPIFVVSDTIISPELTQKFVNERYDGIGKCLIFVSITRLQKDILEVMSLPKDTLDIRENINQITSTFRDKIRKIRDHFNESAKKWYDKLDEEGWILRPIIYKKAESQQIQLLSKAFKTMLINDIDFEELGTKKEVKIPDGEYTDLKMVLKNTFIGKINEGMGYRETGLFEKEVYAISIPTCMNKILKFNEYRKALIEYEGKFFFSGIKEVKPKKIIEQWIDFMVGLKLLMRTNDGFIERISNYELNNRYDLVKKWLEDDCKNEIESMKKVINGPYLKVLEDTQIPYYRVKLEEAGKVKDKVKIEILESRDEKNYENFKETVSNIETFSKLCYEVYDRDGWNNIKTYNPNIIKDIKIDDKTKELWFRIKHIKLFIEYISNLKDPAVKEIQKKINDIKASSMHEGYSLPISPVTNILTRYCTELEYSTDYKKLEASSLGTMVHYINTLAYKLQAGDYSGAYERIEEILDACGLISSEGSELKWSNDSGVISLYKKIFKDFTTIVEGYKKNSEALHWLEYFDDSTTALKVNTEVVNLQKYVNELDMYVNGGLEQEVEDNESTLLSKPEDFLRLLEKSVEQAVQYIGLIKGYKDNVMNLARTEKNRLYNEQLILTIDKIRKVQGKDPASININKEAYPVESTYNATKKDIENKMQGFVNEGEAFFKDSPKANKVTFSFFKNVVDRSGDVSWDEYLDEKKELEALKLIRTKVEVL